LNVPNVSFNLLQKVMVGPWGDQFLADCKALNRPVFLWTVNEERWMKWSISKGVDGVITDDPKKYIEVSEGYDEKKPLDRVGFMDYHNLAWINLLLSIFGVLFRLRVGFFIKPEEMRIHHKGSTTGKATS
jgi:hypothetical protein